MFRVRTLAPRTLFARCEAAPSSRVQPPHRATSLRSRRASRRAAMKERKMLLTDFCNQHSRHEHPWVFRFASMWLSPTPTANTGWLRPLGLNTRALAAPRSLAAAQPHVGTHLTVRIELRSHHAQALSFLSWHRAPLRAALPLPRRCRPRARLVMSTSDAPCRARQSPGNPSCHRKPGPLLPPARQCQWLSRPRAPSIDRCPLAPAFARFVLGEGPPPISRLSHRDSASDALSPSPNALARGG